MRQPVVMTEEPLLDEAIQEKIQIKPFNRNRQAAYKNIPGEGLKEQVEKFEKSVLTHALKQYRNTRMIAYHLKTSQSMLARKLKKYRLSNR